MPETFNRDTFAEVLGSSFKLPAAEDKILDLELVEVSEVRRGKYQESFSLVFRLQEGYSAPQGLYDMSHEKLGAMQLFLVPVGVDDGRMKLEAVFNLIVKEQIES